MNHTHYNRHADRNKNKVSVTKKRFFFIVVKMHISMYIYHFQWQSAKVRFLSCLEIPTAQNKSTTLCRCEVYLLAMMRTEYISLILIFDFQFRVIVEKDNSRCLNEMHTGESLPCNNFQLCCICFGLSFCQSPSPLLVRLIYRH